MELTILIPCLNEEKTIERTIKRAHFFLKKNKIDNFEIIVADNGSIDNSVKIVQSLKIVRLVKVPIPGYGAALHFGILSAWGKYILFADGDLSYDFKNIQKFKPFLKQNVDLVLGSRIRGKIQSGSMPFLNRYFGTPVLTGLIRLIYKINTTDSNSGMRMVRKSFYKKLNMKNSGMEWASELLIRTALNNGVYKEVPINFYKDKRKRPPHLLPWSDGWRHLKAIILLKPNILTVPIFLIFLMSVFFLKSQPDIGLFGFLISVALFLSFIAIKVLDISINNYKNNLIKTIDKVPVVILAIICTITWFVCLLYLPSIQNIFKYLIGTTIILFDIWVLLIETIKTHLINRLPDKL